MKPFHHVALLAATVAAFGIILAMAFGVGQAWPHDAKPSRAQPLGWSYDYSCCSLNDCMEVTDGTVKVLPDGTGYRVLNLETIPLGDQRIKRSKDEFYHRCTAGGDPNALRSICLYVPDVGL